MTRSTIITISILLFILAIGAWFITTLPERQAQRELENSAANAALQDTDSAAPFQDFDGNPANLDQYLGQVLVVTSWASWVPQSAAQLQLLAQTVEPYSDQEVVILAINRAEDKRTAEAYLQTINVQDEVILIVDSDDRYYEAIGGYSMPETLVYDARGNVVGHERGSISAAELRYYIEEALVK